MNRQYGTNLAGQSLQSTSGLTMPKPGMKNKLVKIADLFEMDVLSENEALKAFSVVIQQHAKTQGKLENATD
jgi:hypothetical protein